ncbi:MAG: ATP-binding protein [candidate division KSB1 bacterium]|nr:ATP-binding protein [candidate division KSB1 bacterium]
MASYRAGLKKKFMLSSISLLVMFSVFGSLLLYFFIYSGMMGLKTGLIWQTVFYIAVGITGISVIARIMVQPVIDLTDKVKEVQNGNLEVQMEVNGLSEPADEMDMLFLGFNEMVRRLRQNIHDLRQAKENAEEISRRLKKANEKLEAIFVGIPDGIMIIDRNYRIVDANPVMEKLIGKSLDELSGEHCFEMCQGRESRCSFCRADTVFQLGGHSFTQCTKRTSYGNEERIFEIYDFPLLNEAGQVEQVIEYVKDVTEAVKMQKHLEQAKNLAEIGKMGSIVAHEVRNPLNAIAGAVRFLKGEIENEELQSYLQIIDEQVKRVNAVTDEMLDYARPLFLEFSYCQIQPLIENALKTMQERIRSKKIRVQLDMDGNLPLLPLDEVQVERALLNLIDNAIDAMQPGGRLRISCYYDQAMPANSLHEVVLIIEDDGEGLGERDPEDLFKPFVTTKLRGTGLGLPVVRKIMNSHQGSVHLEPRDHVGTKAVLRFPTTLKVYEAKEHHFSYR